MTDEEFTKNAFYSPSFLRFFSFPENHSASDLCFRSITNSWQRSAAMSSKASSSHSVSAWASWKKAFLKYFDISHIFTFSTFYSTTQSTNDTMTLQNGTQQDEKDSRLIKLGRTFNNFFFNGKKTCEKKTKVPAFTKKALKISIKRSFVLFNF